MSLKELLWSIKRNRLRCCFVLLQDAHRMMILTSMTCGGYFCWEKNDRLKLRGLDFICVKLDTRNLIPQSSGVGRGYAGIWRFDWEDEVLLSGTVCSPQANAWRCVDSFLQDQDCANSFFAIEEAFCFEKGLSFSVELFHWNKRLWHEMEGFLPTEKTVKRWCCQATTPKLTQINKLNSLLKFSAHF